MGKNHTCFILNCSPLGMQSDRSHLCKCKHRSTQKPPVCRLQRLSSMKGLLTSQRDRQQTWCFLRTSHLQTDWPMGPSVRKTLHGAAATWKTQGQSEGCHKDVGIRTVWDWEVSCKNEGRGGLKPKEHRKSINGDKIDYGCLPMSPVRHYTSNQTHIQVTSAQVSRVVSLAKHKLRCIKRHLGWL